MANTPHRNRSLLGLTRVEWLVVLVIVALLIALLYPSVQWVSDGSIQIPVRVFVFDVAHSRPIPDAHVAIVHGPLPRAGIDINEIHERVPDDLFEKLPSDLTALTGKDGTAVVHREFPTSASRKHPESKTHLHLAWVVVQALNYGTVAVPLAQDSMPTALLKEQQELFVPIGLKQAE